MPLIIHAASLSLLIPHSPPLYVWFSGRFYRQLYVTAISCLECYQTDMTSLLRSHEVRAMFFSPFVLRLVLIYFLLRLFVCLSLFVCLIYPSTSSVYVYTCE